MAATDPITPEPRRFAMRLPGPLWIGLATVVFAVMGVGLGFGVPAYRQHQAIVAIQRLGGQVNTKSRGPTWVRNLIGDERMEPIDEVTSFSLGGTTIHDADLAALSVLTRVRRITIYSAQIAEMKSLTRFPNLEMLELDDTPLTASALDGLNRSNTLRSMLLANTSINGLALGRLKSLTALTLERVKITDAGLEEVGRMSQLNALTFRNVSITDDSLHFLMTLTNLAYLRLYETKVTDAGVAELQQARPKLTVER